MANYHHFAKHLLICIPLDSSAVVRQVRGCGLGRRRDLRERRKRVAHRRPSRKRSSSQAVRRRQVLSLRCRGLTLFFAATHL